MSTVDGTRKFHFLREIASGGFGRVYLCKVVHADGFSRLAAVKVLHPKWTENEEVAKRMRDEARLLGMLRHKNIVDVIDLTRIDGRAAVLMEYLEAVDLKVLISEAKRSGKRLPLKAMLLAHAAVASALDAAYNRPPYVGDKPLRVIHRDIKPSNVMIDGNGLPKVLDFGVARAEFEAREAKTQELSFGSVEYMCPERLFFEPESPASDVYSLGATLYEAIALEKLGKAKLRADAHEQFVAERFEDLLEKNPLPSEEVEDLLHDLLYDMLAFEEASRPSAADCVTRMRAFARNLQGESLEEWAERTVPPLVQKYQARVPKRTEGDSSSLVDKVLSEDPSGIANVAAEVSQVGPQDAPPASAAMRGGAEGERWDALKKSTLASLAGEGLGPASSTWNPDVEPVAQKALGPPPVPQGVVTAAVPSEAPRAQPAARRPESAPPVARPESRPPPADPAPRPRATPSAVPKAPLPLSPNESATQRMLVPRGDDAKAADAERDETPGTVSRSVPPGAGKGGNRPVANEPLVAGGARSAAPPASRPVDPAATERAVPRPPSPTPARPPDRAPSREPVATREPPRSVPAPAVAPPPAPQPAPAPRPPAQMSEATQEVSLDAESSYGSGEQRASGGGGGGWFGFAVAALLLSLIVAGGITLVGVVAVVVLYGNLQAGGPIAVPPTDGDLVDVAPAPAPSDPVVEPAPGEPAPEPAAEPEPVDAGPAARFTSRLPGPKKLQVRCDGGQGEGVDVVSVAGTDLGSCTVSALGADRKRASTVIKVTEPREYVCFEGESTTCE